MHDQFMNNGIAMSVSDGFHDSSVSLFHRRNGANQTTKSVLNAYHNHKQDLGKSEDIFQTIRTGSVTFQVNNPDGKKERDQAEADEYHGYWDKENIRRIKEKGGSDGGNSSSPFGGWPLRESLGGSSGKKMAVSTGSFYKGFEGKNDSGNLAKGN